MKKFILFGLLACLASPVVFAQEATPIFDVSKPHTVDTWELLIRGKLNRSEVVKLLGKPDVAMTGSLTFNNRVQDADTDEIQALHVMFAHGEKFPASYVGYLPNHEAGNPPPFAR
ncbi:hypothetical protein [Luteimonas sp. MC1750]|uniref:hypothetical protein n=1 Tax=Luteimonas sp. MC1750 TaxID=2799326 RepID=UPI0018F0E9A9|nr:hypothetical protein [Luteimonas sp. MC1750]MBJ6984018.1 hypothetical protein [Luteimonas sp. MC1750]QQO06830.1 hypothetical protein JGR68_05230 [Luteimonas sp. MC1750]